MASAQSIQFSRISQPCDSLSSDDLRASLEALTTTSLSLLETLREYRKNGRPGHPLTALWRAYLASFILNLPTPTLSFAVSRMTPTSAPCVASGMSFPTGRPSTASSSASLTTQQR